CPKNFGNISVCTNAVHRLQFSIQHNHPSAPDGETEPAGPEHLPLQLDPGLPESETSVSLDREQHLQHHHTEHWCPSRLCAQSTAVHSADLRLNHIIKFADDTTVVGLISKNDESAHREEVQQLTAWCEANNLSLNVDKTKEVVVDFSKATLMDSWTSSRAPNSLTEETHLPPPILTTFCRETIESILSSCITAWFGNRIVSDHKTLQ
ncbi:hypothetical protein QTP70_020489, partial [Hemibagrus guttatus]